MKIAILESPALWLFVFSCLVTTVGLCGLSISTFDRGDPFSLLLFVSACLAWLGAIATLVSSVVLLVAILRRSALRK